MLDLRQLDLRSLLTAEVYLSTLSVVRQSSDDNSRKDDKSSYCLKRHRQRQHRLLAITQSQGPAGRRATWNKSPAQMPSLCRPLRHS